MDVLEVASAAAYGVKEVFGLVVAVADTAEEFFFGDGGRA